MILVFSTVSIARERYGYAYPRIIAQGNSFVIYYEYGREYYMTKVGTNGRTIKRQSEVDDIPDLHWMKTDSQIERKYHLEHASLELAADDRMVFQGTTSDDHLQVFITSKDLETTLFFRDFGYTLVFNDHPYSSNLVIYKDKVYIAAWIFNRLEADNNPLYDLTIIEWDYSRNTARAFPIKRDLKIENTTLSLAITKNMIGLAYYECDDSVNKNRIRLVLLDTANLSVKNNLWVGEMP